MMLARSLLAAALIAGPAIAKKPIDIGPQPDWAKAKVNAIYVVKQNLKDEDSAKFQWRGEGWNQTKKAWVICGRVNSKNSYGGYAGWQQFKMTYVNGTSTGFRFAPEGLGFNECNSDQGYHADVE
jgi:hypothetical protein